MPAPGAKISTPARVWFDVVLPGKFADTILVGSVCSTPVFVCVFLGGRGWCCGWRRSGDPWQSLVRHLNSPYWLPQCSLHVTSEKLMIHQGNFFQLTDDSLFSYRPSASVKSVDRNVLWRWMYCAKRQNVTDNWASIVCHFSEIWHFQSVFVRRKKRIARVLLVFSCWLRLFVSSDQFSNLSIPVSIVNYCVCLTFWCVDRL